ncbi:MAG: hypothetical protein QM330_07840 [Acidobacteriota bacterium]|nr:hypothetical protein [Acidobacteriota bacterium]
MPCKGGGDAPLQGRDRSRPNLLFILADNLGYGNRGCVGWEIQAPGESSARFYGQVFGPVHRPALPSPPGTRELGRL